MSEKSELFDPETIKTLFPTLSQTVSDKPLVYLDNAATSQKPVRVIEALETYYRDNTSNVHRGIYELSRRATEAYETLGVGWRSSSEPNPQSKSFGQGEQQRE